MSILDAYIRYARDFERTYLDDDWSRVAQHFHQHIVYDIHNVPVSCSISGRDQVCHGIKKALNGFDRRCERQPQPPTALCVEGNKTLAHGSVRYRREGETFEITLWQIATFQNDAITHLMDIYDPGNSERYLSWLARWGDLDGAYV